MTRMPRHLPLALVAAAFLCSAACGTGGSPTAPSPPPEASEQTVTLTGRVGVFDIVSDEVPVARDGTLTATLTWTAAVDLDLYLTDVACSGYPPDACAILARSVEESGGREELTRAARAGERYKLWVDNLSRTEPADYTLIVVVR